jgi:hypothetical protein
VPLSTEFARRRTGFANITGADEESIVRICSKGRKYGRVGTIREALDGSSVLYYTRRSQFFGLLYGFQPSGQNLIRLSCPYSTTKQHISTMSSDNALLTLFVGFGGWIGLFYGLYNLLKHRSQNAMLLAFVSPWVGGVLGYSAMVGVQMLMVLLARVCTAHVHRHIVGAMLNPEVVICLFTSFMASMFVLSSASMFEILHGGEVCHTPSPSPPNSDARRVDSDTESNSDAESNSDTDVDADNRETTDDDDDSGTDGDTEDNETGRDQSPHTPPVRIHNTPPTTPRKHRRSS